MDCEVRLGSVFASLLVSLKTDIPQGMAICNNEYRKNGAVGESCTRCGNCRGWTIAEREYGSLANEYAFVSGQALVQFDINDTNSLSKKETLPLESCGDYLDLMFGYAGYSYNTISSTEDKSSIFTAMKESIDQGKPVLLECQIDNVWVIVTGYDDNMDIYGLDGLQWYDRMKPAPDDYEGNLFHSSNWYEAMKRVVIVGDKVTPTTTLRDVTAKNALIMKQTFDADYYNKASDYILDDTNFMDDIDNLRKQAKLINGFIGVPIGCRSIVSWFAFDMLEKDCEDSLRKMLDRVASCCCDIHEICWVLRHAVEGEGVNRLADPLYRKMIADVVKLVGYKDFHVYESLRDYAKSHK
jgi:hypothetical protein